MNRRKYKIIYPSFEKWLRDHDMSITELAHSLNMVDNGLYEILYGFRQPRMNTIRKMLAFTGLTFEELFREEK